MYSHFSDALIFPHENISLQPPARIEALDASATTPNIPQESPFESLEDNQFIQAACSTTDQDRPDDSTAGRGGDGIVPEAHDSSASTSNIPQAPSFASSLASAINRAADPSQPASSCADLDLPTTEDLPMTVAPSDLVGELNLEAIMDADLDNGGFGARQEEPHDATGSSLVDDDPMDADPGDGGFGAQQEEPHNATGFSLADDHPMDADLDGDDPGQGVPVKDTGATTVHSNPSKQTFTSKGDADSELTESDETDTRPSTPAKTSPPTTRPRKRRRVSDRDNDIQSDSNKGTCENPIDVDLHLSLWEPTVLSNLVSIVYWS